MLIKKKRNKWKYAILVSVMSFFITGFCYWLLKHEYTFVGISSQFNPQDSTIHIQVKNEFWTGANLYYTILGDTSTNDYIKVEGARPAEQSAAYDQLPNYPAPAKDEGSVSYPGAIVVAVSNWRNHESKSGNSSYKTFLLDTLPLKTVSLSGPAAYFFGKDGLYSVENKHSKEFEFPIHFELFDSLGNQHLSLLVNAEVAGVSTTKLPMKSLNIKPKQATIGRKVLFGDPMEEQLYSFRLRNAGNDFLLAYMRDVVVAELGKHTNNIILDYEPVVVFINGEFWGLQYIREHISEKNLRSKFSHLRRDQILLGELYEGQVKVVSSGFDYKLDKLMDFVEKEDLSLAENYEKLGQMLNIENFIDYVIIQTFICNTDWPHNNVKSAFLDDQLHFILYDTDFAFAWPFYYQKHVGNYFDFPERIHTINALTYNYLDSLDHYMPSQVGTLYQKLKQSPFFYEKFLTRYKELLFDELSQDRIKETVYKIREQIAPLMPYHIARWEYPASMEDWYLHTEQIITFCEERRMHVLHHLEEKVIAKNQTLP